MSGTSDDDFAHDLRSFGRRRGRKLSPRQASLMSDLLPRVSANLKFPPSDTLASSATAPDQPLWLEIGFGGGEHLIWQAEQNPGVTILGAEPFEDGVVKVLTAIEERRLSNIRLHADDVRPLLRWLPAASVARAFILFPDPWPKARHRKRRLVNAETLGELARVLRPGAQLRIGTDIGDYARTILMTFQSTPDFQWTAQCATDWRKRPADWPETRYEQKAHREGRRCAYFQFVRTG